MSARDRLVPALVGVAAAAFVAWGSWIPSLWGDEAATALSAERTIASLLTMARHLDAMHAAYYALMHAVITVLGASPVALRLPSAVAVGATAAGLVVLMRLLGRGARVGVLAAAVFAVLPRTQYIGQEARSFALDAAVVTWSLVAFTAAVRDPAARRRWWALYGLGVATSIWLFPYDVTVIAVAGAVLAVSGARRMLVPWAVASTCAVAAAAPVLVFTFRERGQVAYLADSPVTAAQVLVSTWFGAPAFAVVAWALIAAALLAAALRRELRSHTLVVAWAFLPMLGLLATQPFLHEFAERYVAFCTPAVGALVAEGVRELWRRGRTLGVVAAAFLLAVAVPATAHQRTPYSESGSDWAALAEYLHRHAAPGDDVLFAQTVSPSQRARNSLRLYPEDFRGLRDVALLVPWYDSATSWHDRALTVGKAVDAGRVTARRVWVVETRGSGSEGLPQLRREGYAVASRHHFDVDTVYELAR